MTLIITWIIVTWFLTKSFRKIVDSDNKYFEPFPLWIYVVISLVAVIPTFLINLCLSFLMMLL